jgi:hypothetical protein
MGVSTRMGGGSDGAAAGLCSSCILLSACLLDAAVTGRPIALPACLAQGLSCMALLLIILGCFLSGRLLLLQSGGFSKSYGDDCRFLKPRQQFWRDCRTWPDRWVLLLLSSRRPMGHQAVNNNRIESKKCATTSGRAS